MNQRIVPTWIDATHFTFSMAGADGSRTTHHVDANTGELSRLSHAKIDGMSTLRGGSLPSSQPSATETALEFINESKMDVQIFWIDTQGETRQYGSLPPGQSRTQHTYSGHAWMVKALDGSFFGSTVAESPPTVARINETFEFPKSLRRARGGNRAKGTERAPNQSADGQFEFRLHGRRLQLRRIDQSKSAWMDLHAGESMDQSIVSPSWSPDGQVIAAWRVNRHPPEDAVTIESSPRNGGRAKIRRKPYQLPGDAADEYRLVAFDAKTGDQLRVDIPTIDFRRPKIHWFGDHMMAVEKVDRGHQRVRLFVVDPVNETSRVVIDESSITFIWTTHGPQVRKFTYLDNTDEVIFASEWSGYRHLYLVDLNDQNASADRWKQNPITSGDWLVREIVEVDEQTRMLDLMVGEFYEDQDPYHRHLVRVSFSGEELVAVTNANGDHSVQFSSDRQFAVVTHSRVDSLPVHELRRVSDGKLVTELMQGRRVGNDDAEAALPTVFSAKGRDGETEIWGNLYFPSDFDPESKSHYPVIEAIYAGPHDSHVPKRYLHSNRFNDLTSLGFVVVQIDGMGTANRSKAFHDRCWHNLKDAGFPDRIAWMKAAGGKFPALDLSRVGIFGTSAGGQNACGALLFHGDFYKSAYASCGCHDNRMDKASWNEQWMGFPVGAQYAASSNIEHAKQLTGNLLLVVGELDQNVPPESTYRLVDALVKADKDFEFLMIPGMGHSDGGSYGRRRMRDFFVRTLKP